MPRLTIDGRTIEVPEGTKVIEAAERLGIMIPRFCFHPALGAVGACRVCAVAFLEGPVKGIQMSCMEDAKDGMVVSTTDERAVDFRRHVLEWLMLNHPHDCPVCDEGGQCLLQDMTVSSGHAIRRYRGPKRTFRDQYLGPLVEHQMNRCIQCYRCRRFYQEFAGYKDLGAMQIANKVYFGRFREGALESPFSGNLIDVCPTGVFTDRPARHRGRQWEYERGPSLCIHCSAGCHTIGNAKNRRLWRIEARFSDAVNGHFLCDRGRFGFTYEHAPDRPRSARIGQTETSLLDALTAAAERLGRIPADRIACVTSPRASLETLSAAVRVSRALGWHPPALFESAEQDRKVRAALASLPGRRVSLREIEAADFVLVAGSDPLAEAPMLALALRQAFRKGAPVAVLDPRPVSLPFDFEHLPLGPGDLELAVEALSSGGSAALDALNPGLRQRVEGLGERLRRAERPVVVCGTELPSVPTLSLAGRLATAVGAGLYCVLPGANAFAGALLFSEGAGVLELLGEIEAGRITSLVVLEADPWRSFPDRERREAALERLELLLVLDYLPSGTAARAHVLLPTRTIYEAGGVYINGEGRAQRARAVHRGGLPLEQETSGSHPPRVFRREAPGSEPRGAHEVLSDLAFALAPGLDPAELAGLGTECVPMGNLLEIDPESEGVLVSPPPMPEARPGATAPSAGEEGDLALLFVPETFGTEELSSYSAPLRDLEAPPWLALHPVDAADAGLSPGDLVGLGGEVVDVRLRQAMARGMVLLPRRGTLWQRLGARPSLGRAELVPLSGAVAGDALPPRLDDNTDRLRGEHP